MIVKTGQHFDIAPMPANHHQPFRPSRHSPAPHGLSHRLGVCLQFKLYLSHHHAAMLEGPPEAKNSHRTQHFLSCIRKATAPKKLFRVIRL
jgi:hypothetical protein